MSERLLSRLPAECYIEIRGEQNARAPTNPPWVEIRATIRNQDQALALIETLQIISSILVEALSPSSHAVEE